jgi:polar amino acid transport system substrate-binding protein
MRNVVALGAALGAAVVLSAGCAASSSDGAGTSLAAPTGGSAQASSGAVGSQSAQADQCTPATMQTHSSGKLTVATDSPAYEPWFVGNDPSNGKGFESAVAFAVAKQLGYSASQVDWVKATFNSVISPAPKNYDFDINEVSITPKRAQVVDFSSGYYDVAQAIVVLDDNKYAGATSVAALKGAKLGAQQGTTSFDAINEVIKPSQTPAEYPTNNLAVQALKNGTIDGLVVDLPTGLYVTAAQVPHSKIVGQLPVTGQPEQFGLVLDKGSSLTSCVTQAVDKLRGDGTLAQLQKRWLTGHAGAPVLK